MAKPNLSSNYQLTKTCSNCAETKPLADFDRDRTKKDGATSTCKVCARIRSRKWQTNNPGRAAQRVQRYRERHPERVKECTRRGHIKFRTKLRRLVMETYAGGTPKCACCNETEEKFLEIDHVYNDGAKHRKEIKQNNGNDILIWLRNNNFPAGFQILCRNCNRAKYLYGKCPHLENPIEIVAPLHLNF